MIEGSLVMAIELLAGSVIIPFYGNGLEVWTFILGITMASLAIGYYLGSIVSKNWNISAWLTILYLTVGATIIFIPYLSQASFEAAINDQFGKTIFAGVFPVLFLPLCLCGMISSLLICHAAETGNDVSNSTGSIYGFSTLAGVVTALFIGLFALENLENSLLFFLFSCLSLTAVFLLNHRFMILKYMGFGTVFLSVLFCYLGPAAVNERSDVPGTKTIYKSRGILGEVKVVDEIVSGTRMLYVNNALQSTLGKDGLASLPYVKYIGFFLSHRSKNEKLLLAGLGGGNLLRDLKPLGFKTDVVEMDERIAHVAEKYFGSDFSGCNVIIDDARHFINTSDEKYDIIILDLSQGEIIPSNIYTMEAFEKIDGLLTENGLLVLHLFCSEKGNSVNSILSLGKTMESIGWNVYLFNNDHDPYLPSPYIFAASKKKIDFATIRYANYGMSGNRIFPSPDGDIRKMDYSSGQILTDDQPLLEIYQKEIVAFFRTNYIRDYFKFLTKNR